MNAFKAELTDHQELFGRLDRCETAIDEAMGSIVSSFKSGGKLLIAGNGGSAADAQHIAGEFIGRFKFDRPPLPAIALTTDSSVLTCIGNDYGFDDVFVRQVHALASSDDILLVISTSGNSKNLLDCVEVARKKGVTVVFFGGKDGGTLKSLSDISIVVPSQVTARIQEAHIFIAHYICGQVEKELFG